MFKNMYESMTYKEEEIWQVEVTFISGWYYVKEAGIRLRSVSSIIVVRFFFWSISYSAISLA